MSINSWLSGLLEKMGPAIGEVIGKAVAGIGDAVAELFVNPDLDFAAGLPRVVIVGGGGTGKSTILKQMLGIAVRNGRVPVWVALAELPIDRIITPSSFMEFLVLQARSQVGMEDVGRAFFDSLIRDGQLTIGFDALDECGSLERQQRARALIEEVARDWKKCQIFVTSRPEAFAATPLRVVQDAKGSSEKELPSDTFIRYAPSIFTREDVRPFLRVAFEDENGTLADRLLALGGIDALIDTPLTLTLVALIAADFDIHESPDANLTRSSLFEACIRTACGTWDGAKPNEALEDGLSFEERMDALRRLGWAIQCGNSSKIDVGDAISVLVDARLLENRPRALTLLNALAQRNMLLRSTFSNGRTPKLVALELAHPQFREYLAGAYLADRYLTEPEILAMEMAPRWFENRWLDTLRFALANLVESSLVQSEGLFQLILSAEDPYRDLLHRPEFLVAALLGSIQQASDKICEQIIATLEQIGGDEPALHDVATELLLECAQHKPACEALLRMAKGEGLAVTTGSPAPSSYIVLRRWQLRAIRALAPVIGLKKAVALLPPAQTFEDILQSAEVRALIGDYNGARALWRSCFNERDRSNFASVESSMDRASQGHTLNAWLTELPPEEWSHEEFLIGVKRGVVARDAKELVQYFDKAAAELQDLPEEEPFAPAKIIEPVYVALQDGVGLASAAGKALLRRALWHPATAWYVGPSLGRLQSDFAGEAIDSMVHYIKTDDSRLSTDWSRLNTIYFGICSEPNDSLAVPALLGLMKLSGSTSSRRWGRGKHDLLLKVAESLRQRGKTNEALEILKTNLIADTDKPRYGSDDSNRANWKLAFALDPEWTLHHYQTFLEEHGQETDPGIVAKRLKASGAISIIGELFRLPSATDAERDLIEKVAMLDPDVSLQLSSSTPHFQPTETEPAWTLAEAERAALEAIQRNCYRNMTGGTVPAGSQNIGNLLATIEELGGKPKAIALADMWVARAAAESATEAEASSLLSALSTLSAKALSKPEWFEIAAEAARARGPSDRFAIITWLSTNVRTL